jgi:hypothetical protein
MIRPLMMEPITIKYETYKNPSGQLRKEGEEGGEEQNQKERETKQKHYCRER